MTKNDFLAKLVCLFGFHKYILHYQPKQLSYTELKEQLSKDAVGKPIEQWVLTKRLKDAQKERFADKYLQYSFKKDFLINGRDVEVFEAPKILGDVFESLVGAIFMDGGIEKVLEVY